MPKKGKVTLVSTGDLALIYGVPPATAKKWRQPGQAPTAASAPERSRHHPVGPRLYDPQAAAGSILGKRVAHVSARDLYDLDVVIERIRERTGREPLEAWVTHVRERATVPVSAVVAGYAEVGQLLGLDQRHVKTMDDRGQLPAPVALVGPEGRKSQVKVFAASQFAQDARYSEERAKELAARHLDGP